ncbi:MAG TPA: serine hydrolase domain-containing protein [Gemmatimonadales bacterium]|nr:serine hydrolase domain-containing protein [Gemmatimonadales bacterium]
MKRDSLGGKRGPMIRSRLVPVIAWLILSSANVFAQTPSDAAIRKILADRVYAQNLGIGIVVGVIDAHGRRVFAFGGLSRTDKSRPDGETVFEIGSITKEFTSLLLTDMARRGEVALTDPVSKYLPADVKMPERNNRKITLADLSTHSSGLPRMPSNFKPKDDANPYADYSVQQLYDFLSGYRLTRDIGTQYEYSNLGAGLLGHALSLRAAMSYEALLRARVLDPLGMSNTRITLTPEMKARLAMGHKEAPRTSDNPYGLAPVPNWDIPTLSGAGALRSSANDMLTFLAAYLGYVKTPLADAMADQLSIRRQSDGSDFEVGYGWRVQTKYGSTIVWHGGATGGYRCYIGFDPEARVGVIVLSNVLMPLVDDIGPHLLNPKYPLSKDSPFDGK